MLCGGSVVISRDTFLSMIENCDIAKIRGLFQGNKGGMDFRNDHKTVNKM